MSSPDTPLTAPEREAIIERLITSIHAHYVFPEVADQIEAVLRARLAENAYTHSGSVALCEALTQELQAVAHDKHLNLRYSADPLDEGDVPLGYDPAFQEQEQMFARFFNHGFAQVSRLPGNIGYLDLRGFFGVSTAGETAVAAMNFLANTSALIVDLRKNGGGDPAMVAFLTSYLFEGDSVHLNSLYWRASDRTQQFWTHPFVPGRRFGAKPVYVLTSNETFSGAEEFAYNLKQLKRATIIGETTGGGANPGAAFRLSTHIFIFIPTGRALNPISGTNWEGAGVEPDIAVPADEALQQAQIKALHTVIEIAKDQDSWAYRELLNEARAALADLE